MLENPATVLPLLFSFRETGLPVTTFTAVSQKVVLWAAGGARERSIKGRDPCVYQKSVMFQEMGTTVDSTKIHTSWSSVLEWGERQKAEHLFRWWYSLWRNRKRGQEIGTGEGRSGFLGGSAVKNPPANAGDTGDVGSTPGSGRFPGGGNGNPLKWENRMDRGVWRPQSVGSQSQTQLSDWARTHAHTRVGQARVFWEELSRLH